MKDGILAQLRDYCHFLRYSPDDEKCKFLRSTYNKSESSYILPYTDESPENAKMASRNIIPFEFVTSDNLHRVQSNKIVKDFFNPIRLFFGIKSP